MRQPTTLATSGSRFATSPRSVAAWAFPRDRGFLGALAGVDQPASAARTSQLLSWAGCSLTSTPASTVAEPCGHWRESSLCGGGHRQRGCSIDARTTSQTNACINNLRQIDGAKQEWALELKKTPTSTPVASDLQPYMGRGSGGSLPICPLDSSNGFATSYNPQAVNTAPTCLIAGAAGTAPLTNHVLN